jgi:hypothetical protein
MKLKNLAPLCAVPELPGKVKYKYRKIPLDFTADEIQGD